MIGSPDFTLENNCLSCHSLQPYWQMYRCFDCKAWLCENCITQHLGNQHEPHPLHLHQWQEKVATLQSELAACQEAVAKAREQISGDEYFGTLRKESEDRGSEIIALKAKLARYTEAEKMVPEIPVFYAFDSHGQWTQCEILTGQVNANDYNKLRDHAIAQTARVKELEAEPRIITCQIYGHKIGVSYCENCNVAGPEDAAKRLLDGFNSGKEGEELLNHSRGKTTNTDNCLQITALQEALLKAEAERDAAVKANPCETHLNVRASGGYCPVCLTEERDAAVRTLRELRNHTSMSSHQIAIIDAAIKAEGEKRG